MAQKSVHYYYYYYYKCTPTSIRLVRTCMVVMAGICWVRNSMRSQNALLVRYPLTWACTSTMKSSLALNSISLLCSAVTSDITPCTSNKIGLQHHLSVVCCVPPSLLISLPAQATRLVFNTISLLCSAVTSDITPCTSNKTGLQQHLSVVCCPPPSLLISLPAQATRLVFSIISLLCSAVISLISLPA